MKAKETFLKWFYNGISQDDVTSRLFLIVSSAIAIAAFTGVISNYLLGFDLLLSLFCLLIALITIAYFFRVRKNKKATCTDGIFLAATVLFFLILFWPLNGGFEGPILLYFLSVPVYLAYFLNRRHYYIMISVIYIGLISMLIYYFKYPEEVVPYSSREIQLLDIIISIIISGIILGEFSIYFKEQNNRIRSEIEAKNEVIQLQFGALKDLDTYKNTIFATLGHDLRGPINNAKGLFDLLIDDEISKTQKEELIKVASSQMEETAALVENILFWARSQMGGLHVNNVNFEVNKAVQTIIEGSQNSIKKKKIFIQNNASDLMYAFGDKDLFYIILRNLVNNAIKFSNTGSIITINNFKNYRGEIEIQVIDEGIGMSETQLSQIFVMGKTTEGTKKEKGTGLGLKLSKMFTEANGGKITAESKLGNGTKITFTIKEGSKAEVIGSNFKFT